MDFSNKSGAEGRRSAESGPMLLDVLEGYLKYKVYLLLDHYHIAEARIIFLFLFQYIEKKGKLLGVMYPFFCSPVKLYGPLWILLCIMCSIKDVIFVSSLERKNIQRA